MAAGTRCWKEMPQCNAYFEREVSERGLQRTVVHAEPGDAVFWHCHLLQRRRTHRRPFPARGLDVRWLPIIGADLVCVRGTSVNFCRDSCSINGITTISTIPTPRPWPKAPQPTANIEEAQAPMEPSSQAGVSSDESLIHPSFDTWNIDEETLEQVEARIHDGVPIGKLRARAEGYVKTIQKLFPDAAPPPGCRAMEIGSGVGYIMEAFQNRFQPAELIGLDVAPGMVHKAVERLQRDQVDSSNITFWVYDGNYISHRR